MKEKLNISQSFKLQLLFCSILLGLFSCSNFENNTEKDIQEKDSSILDKKLLKVDSGFTTEKQMSRIQSDSSYIDYWCSINILKKTDKRIDNLDLVIIADFLATFNQSCNSNVEYSEWSNELLFKVLENKPEIVLQLLIKNSSLHRNYILTQLETPINDAINLDSLVSKISKVEKPQSNYWKPKIIKSLTIAKEKK